MTPRRLLLALLASAGLFATQLLGSGCSDCGTSITTPSLPDAVVGVNYFVELNSDCGGDVWFIQSGLLPPGISLQDTGKLRGVPTLDGTYPFTVGVFDFDSGDTAYKGFALTVEPAQEASPSPTPLEPSPSPTP
ncbi:MAG: putative Ig domain-containing protein [Deltaproteobacteria bacterium]|nr:putative Ig domain-containing protein [Deltaproteobacteria bacterium]